MNAKFKKCLDAYLNNRSSENQYALEKVYISEFEDREEIRKEILNLVKNDIIDIDDDKNKAIPWEDFFLFDKLFYIEVLGALNEKEAEDFLEDYQKGNIAPENARKKLYPIVYSYTINSMGINALGEKIYRTWEKVLHENPELIQIMESLKEENSGTGTKKLISEICQKKPIKVVEISFPFKATLDGKSISKEEQEEVERSEVFHSVMKMFEERLNKFTGSIAYPNCYDSTVKFNNPYFTFTMNMQKYMDLLKLKSCICDFIFLKNRITDRIIPVLIKNNLYYFEIDIQNSTEFTDIA